MPDLWLDVFQKVKALGYNTVSFYVDWALLEGQRGAYRASGIFALQPFFDAASQAGIHLLARPGPYINAEVSGGGFPGWLSRVGGTLRTNAPDFLKASDYYMREVCSTIAEAQITNGGPVVLFQPENEYTYPANHIDFPNDEYFQYVIDQALNAGIVVPMISNDAGPLGIFAPGNTSYTTHVDIYGHDSYPQGFNCELPYYWKDDAIPTNYRLLHERQSPLTPYSVIEFQGGSFDPWGGYGVDNCATLTNEQFERVFYKNNWSFGLGFHNVYMIYGGTNWGNLGHPLGYTSYDYGASIREDRSVSRAKYSENKLGANFLKASPAYLTAASVRDTLNDHNYTDSADISATILADTKTETKFLVVRHAAYNSNSTTSYTVNVVSSLGSITIPQSNALTTSLTLNGRDSKVHVVDYDIGGRTLLYSSAEVFTWQKYETETILVLYGGQNEVHELATAERCTIVVGSANEIAMDRRESYTVVQWSVTPVAKQLRCGSVSIYLLWRYDAYNWWTLELPAAAPVLNYSSTSKSSVIVTGGYLMRTVRLKDGNLYLTGDINQTTTITVIGGPHYNGLYFNGKRVNRPSFGVEYSAPNMKLPDFSSASWWSLDSLPELASNYSDTAWTVADRRRTVNPLRPTTPQVLYASDYGYHSGSLVYRGHFVSATDPSALNLSLSTQGGQAYGYSVFLNSTCIYQYPGMSTSQNHTVSLALSDLEPNSNYLVTILIDHMGLTEDFNPGADTMREPRGLLSYNLTSSEGSRITMTWKLTGNFGGEDYVDPTRGPLNEGGMFFERQGYHLPNVPLDNSGVFFPGTSPLTGFAGPGLRFYATKFTLDIPTPEYDVPLEFVFKNSTGPAASVPAKFRAQLYINGFQFGKYVNHIGPQTSFPVPEGILNYKGENHVGVSLWNMESDPHTVVKLDGFALRSSSTPVMSGRENRPRLSFDPVLDAWHKREGAY